MLRDIWSFITVVKRHWVYLLTGSLLAVGAEAWQAESHKVSSQLFGIAAVVALFVACFLAWRDEYRAKNAALTEVQRLRAEGTATKFPSESWEMLYAERKRLTDDLELLESQKEKALLTGFPLELMSPLGWGRERKIQRIKDDLRLVNERLKLYHKNTP